MNTIYTTAIILASGKSTRMNNNTNKLFLKLNDVEIITYTISTFQNNENINNIIVVTSHDNINDINSLKEVYNWSKISNVVEGGQERQHSVYNGLKSINPPSDCDNIVVIHDGARPFISSQVISNSIQEAVVSGGCIVAVPIKDTIKICDENNNIISTPNRKDIWLAQTPQTFKYDIILKAHEESQKNDFLGTDDASLLEHLNIPVKTILGDYNNIKITTQEDLIIAKEISKLLFKDFKIPKIETPKENKVVTKTAKKKIVIYTDGACHNNPGAGGYGAVLMHGSQGQHRKEISQGYKLTTNNRMELLAVIKALQILKEPCIVSLYSDSKYVIDSIQKKWVYSWQKNNWRKSDKSPAINSDLWGILLPLLEKHDVSLFWVKGHNNDVENERCDYLATQATLTPPLLIDEEYEKISKK